MEPIILGVSPQSKYANDKHNLIIRVLEEHARHEYGLPFELAKEKSKGSYEEFSNLYHSMKLALDSFEAQLISDGAAHG